MDFTNNSFWTSPSSPLELQLCFIYCITHFDTLNWSVMNQNQRIVCTWGFERGCSSVAGPKIRWGTLSSPVSLWTRGRGFGQRTRVYRWWWTRYTALCPAIGGDEQSNVFTTYKHTQQSPVACWLYCPFIQASIKWNSHGLIINDYLFYWLGSCTLYIIERINWSCNKQHCKTNSHITIY